MAINEFFLQNANTIARYVLLPILFALIIYVLLEIYSAKKGVSLQQGFHAKSFIVSVIVIFGWFVYFIVPSELYLPQEALTVRFVYGLFMLIVTVQYLVFLGTELFSKAKTILTLGLGAGLLRTTLAVSVVAPMCKENEDMSYQGATSVMLANTVAVMRNFIIMLVVSIWLGLFRVPPMYFIAPMLVMFIVSAIITFINYKKSMGAEEAEFKVLSVKGTALFLIIFIAMYYLAVFILDTAGFFGLHALSGLAGFLYGAAHIFILASMFFAEKITLEVGLFAVIFVTAGSILSDIPYAFFGGAKKLTKILVVSELIPVIIGLITLYYFLP